MINCILQYTHGLMGEINLELRGRNTSFLTDSERKSGYQHTLNMKTMQTATVLKK